MFVCYKYFSHVRSVMADIIWIITVQWASLWMDHSPKNPNGQRILVNGGEA